MVKWIGKRIQALTLHRQVDSDEWLPTRGLLSRENYPFLAAYAWALRQVMVLAIVYMTLGMKSTSDIMYCYTGFRVPVPESSCTLRHVPSCFEYKILYGTCRL